MANVELIALAYILLQRGPVIGWQESAWWIGIYAGAELHGAWGGFSPPKPHVFSKILKTAL